MAFGGHKYRRTRWHWRLPGQRGRLFKTTTTQGMCFRCGYSPQEEFEKRAWLA